MASLLFLAALLLTALLAFLPQSAQAQTSYSHVGEFGGAGTGPGVFGQDPAPQRLAVHEASGKILAVDQANDRIQVFEPNATDADFGFQFGGSATTDQPIGVAVDQSTGDAYVTAAGSTNAIVKFNPDDSSDPAAYTEDGSFTSPAQGPGTGEIGAFSNRSGFDTDKASGGGIAVDPTTGEILVADPGKNLIQRFDSDGTYISDFDGCTGFLCADRPAFTGVWDVATLSNGDIIVADVDTSSSEGRVDRFDSAGNLQATLSEGNDPVPSSGNVGIVVGTNQATGEVFVSSVTGSAFGDPETRVYQFHEDEYVDDFAAPDHFQGYLLGMVGDGGSERFYVMAGAERPAFGGGSVPRVQVFRGIDPPTVSIDPPTGMGATEATFHGVVNPEGSEVSWRFEYRPVGATEWARVPEPDGDAGSGTADVTVEATAQDLRANTAYEVRLVALAPGGVSSESDPLTFATEPGAPFATTVGANFLSDREATLTGWVNPRNSETVHHFEWGTDTGYGNVIPDPAASIGDGGDRVVVTEKISGLEPGTTYHFRVVSENEFGQRTEGEDRTFTTSTEPPLDLGPKRQYEHASPRPTGGIQMGPSETTISADGNRVTYRTGGTGPRMPHFDLPHLHVMMERGASGWSSEPIDLPDPDRISFGRNVVLPIDHGAPVALSTVGHHPDDQNGAVDLYQRRPDGGLTWISRGRLTASGEPQQDPEAVGLTGLPRTSALSEDGSVVVFESERRLLEEDENNSESDEGRLYKWSDGDLSLVSVRPDGTMPTGAGVQLGSIQGPGTRNSPNAVSRDGSRVVWSDGSTLFVNVDGEDPAEVGEGNYAGASRDVSRIIFYDDERVYSYEVDSGATNDLTGAASVRGVTAVPDTAERVYFVADEQLESEASPLGETPSSDGRNLYAVDLADDGSAEAMRFIAALGPEGRLEDAPVWDNHYPERASATSSDGRILAFGSVKSITGEPTNGTRQLYVYDAERRVLECGSCPSGGVEPHPSNVNPVLRRDSADGPAAGGFKSVYAYKRLVSPEGSVFFTTRTQLDSDDRNDVRDVYEYRNGQVRLVTRGLWDDAPSGIVGVSADGRTVALATSDALVGRDVEDGTMKLYVARLGGGFSDPTPELPCSGDTCQEPPEAAPEMEPPASESVVPRRDRVNPAAERCDAIVDRWRQVRRLASRARAMARRLVLHARATGSGAVATSTRLRMTRRIKRANRMTARASMRSRHLRRQAVQCRRAVG